MERKKSASQKKAVVRQASQKSAQEEACGLFGKRGKQVKTECCNICRSLK